MDTFCPFDTIGEEIDEYDLYPARTLLSPFTNNNASATLLTGRLRARHSMDERMMAGTMRHYDGGNNYTRLLDVLTHFPNDFFLIHKSLGQY